VAAAIDADYHLLPSGAAEILPAKSWHFSVHYIITLISFSKGLLKTPDCNMIYSFD